MASLAYCIQVLPSLRSIAHSISEYMQGLDTEHCCEGNREPKEVLYVVWGERVDLAELCLENMKEARVKRRIRMKRVVRMKRKVIFSDAVRECTGRKGKRASFSKGHGYL